MIPVSACVYAMVAFESCSAQLLACYQAVRCGNAAACKQILACCVNASEKGFQANVNWCQKASEVIQTSVKQFEMDHSISCYSVNTHAIICACTHLQAVCTSANSSDTSTA